MKKLRSLISSFVLIALFLPSAFAFSLETSTNEQKADILNAYRSGLDILYESSIALLEGLDLSANTSILELKMAYLIVSYQEAQKSDKVIVENWKKAIELCGTYSDTQTMKGYLSELVAIYSPLLNYNITADVEVVLEYMRQATEKDKVTREIMDKIEVEIDIWNQAINAENADTNSSSWSDKPSTWAVTLVNEAIAIGIVPEKLQAAYNKPITRAEFCSLAVAYYENATGTTIKERQTFNDTNDIDVQKMAGLGVVTGVGKGNFDPNATLTREQAATILSRLAQALGNPIEESESTFADSYLVSSWAKNAVGQMQQSEIMGGVGHDCFDPQSAYTREQSIVTVKRMDSRRVLATDIDLDMKAFFLPTGVAGPIPQDAQRPINATVLPETTTNKNLTWTSSDEGIATVSASGVVRAIHPGTTEITASAIGASKTVKITVCDYVVVPPLPLSLNCIEHTTKAPDSQRTLEYLPEHSMYAGEIQLTEYVEHWVKNTYDEVVVTVSGTVTNVSSDLERIANPYVKWQLRNASGDVIDNGITYSFMYTTKSNGKVGDEVRFSIPLKLPNPLEYCTIEFISDDSGRSKAEIDTEAFINAQANAPTIELPQLPFTLSTSVVITTDEKDRFGNPKARMVDRDTLSIDEISYGIADYDRKRDCYEIELFCSGTAYYPYISYNMAPDCFSWKLLDENGEKVGSGSFYAPDFDYESGSGDRVFKFSNESMGTVRNLSPGTGYTLILQPSR